MYISIVFTASGFPFSFLAVVSNSCCRTDREASDWMTPGGLTKVLSNSLVRTRERTNLSNFSMMPECRRIRVITNRRLLSLFCCQDQSSLSPVISGISTNLS
ncbi:hypothetical protein BC939DRAFT_35590 [Gamsiella multidivaricata]|uniref:uncharacterized protein n=1 Tax=Gamsiella multidivaricata TaxID=101098 RepID=UPI00221E492B|nr:uncharacterized protein BC939DRAFT_35590 [Gamsiella multidivaricata]KAI7816632.1 hypothetical protein BC939DRAFT_35590 [Gamsiella multidivaricata]